MLGFLNGLAYFSTVMLLVGMLLVGMLLVGMAFLVSALADLAVLRSSWNLLASSMSNVVFSLVTGLLLLVLGAYGRASGNLPEDSPYRHTAAGGEDGDPGPPPERYAATRPSAPSSRRYGRLNWRSWSTARRGPGAPRGADGPGPHPRRPTAGLGGERPDTG